MRSTLKVVFVFLLALSLRAAPDDMFTAVRINDLLAIKRGDVAARDRRGNTPLLYAAGFGSTSAMRVLIERGADVNARNSFDATPLIWAAANLEKVRLLVDRGADVNAKTRQGRTA